MQVMEENNQPESLLSSISSHELQELSDLFWLKLGIEHCNMREWASNNAIMLQTNLGKSHPLVKLFFQFHTKYSNLSCTLDDMICSHYPRNISNINVPPSFQSSYDNKEDRFGDTSERRSIIGIFYRSYTIQQYPTMKYSTDNKKRYCGYVSTRDIQYIRHFVTRHERYLEYLNSICDSITKYNTYYKANLHRKIKDLQSKNQRLHELLLNLHIEEYCIAINN